MRLYLVRRTRSFIQENYADTDEATGRKYLTFADGTRSYFPKREPKTVKFKINDDDPDDQFAKLYSSDMVDAINGLNLPRYGLGNYLAETPSDPPTAAEGRTIADLSRAGPRLKGFCRTNLFKRLESSGQAFVQSLERHILRNFVYPHALESGEPVPIGTQDAEILDERYSDQDDEALFGDEDEDGGDEAARLANSGSLRTDADFRQRAAAVYREYAARFQKRFKWLKASRFKPELAEHLREDIDALMDVSQTCGSWDPNRDAKLQKLTQLLVKKHAGQKVLVFSQFADTVEYLARQLAHSGVPSVGAATGDTDNPTRLAWRFSPDSNKQREHIPPADELRVLLATDVLSEGQNLQDAAVVVNDDLPWAIIRLIQRAGRVDRIGQKAEVISC